MSIISDNYLGLSLSSPIIAASSTLSQTPEGVRLLAESGVGAIVLKSLYEEEIDHEIFKTMLRTSYLLSNYEDLDTGIRRQHIDAYLDLIKQSKDSVQVPIIASIGCSSPDSWVEAAQKIQEAGADALELNVMLFPLDDEQSSEQNEKAYFSIIKNVNAHIDIPIALKMSPYSSGLSKLVQKLSWTGDVESLILFGRHYMPDIDIETLQPTASQLFSSPMEMHSSLRWVALLYGKAQCQLVGATGVHSGNDVIKFILAGASAVQVASALYSQGLGCVSQMNDRLQSWMESKQYNSLSEFRGLLSQKIGGHKAFERIQFMRFYNSI